MTEAVKIRIKKEFKDNDIRERIERVSFILTGIVLILSVYEKIPNLLSGSDPVSSLHTSVSLAAGIFTIFYGILIRRITSDNLKEIINRTLFGTVGGLLLIEAYSKFIFTSSSIFIPLFIGAVLYLSLAIFYDRIQSLKTLTLDDKGIAWRTTPFRKKSFLWKDVSSIYLEENYVKISLNRTKSYTLHFVKFMTDEEHDRFINTVEKYSALGDTNLISSQIYEN